MGKALTLSLVIPAYNEEDHIARCLEAIAKQTVKPLEVIVVDNNSTDRTAAIAEQYPFVQVIHELRQGVTFARNRGFNAARGDLIGRIDADSLLKPGWVAHALRFYGSQQRHRTTALTGSAYIYNLTFPRLSGWFQGQIAFRMNRLILGHYITWGSNMVIPKEMWENVRDDLHYRNDIHEDLDLAIHLHEDGYDITYQAGWQVGIDARLHTRHKRRRQRKYLEMWPQTLRVHKLPRTWMGEWGAHLLYWGYYPVYALNWFGGLFFRPKHIN